MSFFVHSLTNQARTVLYIGVTNDLERRLYEHRQGVGDAGKFTGRYQGKLLVHCESSPAATQATAREKQLKKWSRAKKEALTATLNPDRMPIDLRTWEG